MIETGGAILARLTGLYDGFCAIILGNWLLESLLASTILCAIVLLIRRPVARLFGPHIAYGLWLLPALRMVMPPLPADLMPMLPRLFVAHASNGETILSADYFLAALPSAQTGAWVAYIPTLIVTLWLGGALVHLGWQLWGHSRLLDRLADAETIGWQRDVRILRTRAISGPLSVGLLRRSVVLPHESRLALNAQERDLAIVHELTHHARGDLWANVVAVIFSALHWFNPLMRHAWRAFRFDQEAACDAHVLRHVGGALRHLDGGVEAQPAALQLLEDDVERHHLGERGRMQPCIGILFVKHLAGATVHHDGREGGRHEGRRHHNGADDKCHENSAKNPPEKRCHVAHPLPAGPDFPVPFILPRGEG